MRVLAVKAGGHGALGVGRDIKLHPKLLARTAGFAFTNDRELGGLGRRKLLNLRLKFSRLCKLGLQHRHVDNPRERVGFGVSGVKYDLAAIITVHLHFEHGRSVLRLGPAAQRFEQEFGFLIQRKGSNITPDIAVARHVRAIGHNQGDFNSLFGQHQRQRTTDNATAANADIKPSIKRTCHAGDCRRQGKIEPSLKD